MFPRLNLIPATLKITKNEDKYFVWDVWRKKKIQLTPEEWVRQHLLHFLVNYKGFPSERMAVEMQIEVNQLKRRCDAVVFNQLGNPQIIIECKEPDISINAQVVHQIAQYNAKLNTQWLILSNGLEHVTIFIDAKTGALKQHTELPNYSEFNP
jgi:hypothetical protein